MLQGLFDNHAFYNWMLTVMNCFVGISVMQGGVFAYNRSCSRPLASYMIGSGLIWAITGIQDYYARKEGWFRIIEFPNPAQVLQAKVMVGFGIVWLLCGNYWVLTTTTCANSLFWTARYYCILANMGGILLICLLCFGTTSVYAESLLGMNYAIVWRKKFSRDPVYSDIDAADAEYAAFGR